MIEITSLEFSVRFEKGILASCKKKKTRRINPKGEGGGGPHSLGGLSQLLPEFVGNARIPTPGFSHAGRLLPALTLDGRHEEQITARLPARHNRPYSVKISWKMSEIHENIYYCNIKQPTVLCGYLMQNEAFISPKPFLIL